MSGFIDRIPIPGEVLSTYSDADEPDATNELFRVLAVSSHLNRIVMIRATPKRSAGRLYFTNPRVETLSWLTQPPAQSQFTFLKGGIRPRPDVLATPAELDKKYKRKGQRKSAPRRERARRLWMIRPLINPPDPEDKHLLLDPQIRHQRIAERAAQIAKTPDDIDRIRRRLTDILNQYWAEGSTPGAVTPHTGSCGGRGKRKDLKNRKIGRPNTASKNGIIGEEGYVLSEEDKDLCGYAWRTYYTRRSTKAKAYRKFLREFYARVVIDEHGKTVRHYLPSHQRPTKTQFTYWGAIKSPGHESWKKHLSRLALNRIDRVLFGSANEQITRIGQRGAIDSTTTDTEFVSVMDRLKRIGQAHRVLIVDAKYKYIPGFYMGLDAPGSMTVQLAYLHALTDKTEWLQWLGLDEQDVRNWIPIRFSNLLADNTDARAQAAMTALQNVDTGVKLVPVARSDLNSDVETSHHMLHRKVDHNLVGTTHGQRHERGDEKADVLARLTIIEGIRETARAIYHWNTAELDIQPTLEMQRELIDKGIKLTRANLTRWDIERGNLAVNLRSDDENRTALLMPVRGTFTPKGVVLLRTDSGETRKFVSPIRYISRNPLIMERTLASKVARSRSLPTAFDDDFLYDPYCSREIYHRDLYSGELIRLTAKTNDPALLTECSIPDVNELVDANRLRLFVTEARREDALSELEAAQEETNRLAEEAYQEALKSAGKAPAKTRLRKQKTENRKKEKETMAYGMPEMPIEAPETRESPTPQQLKRDAGGSTPPDQGDDPAQPNVSVAHRTAADDSFQPGSKKRSLLEEVIRCRQTEGSHA